MWKSKIAGQKQLCCGIFDTFGYNYPIYYSEFWEKKNQFEMSINKSK